MIASADAAQRRFLERARDILRAPRSLRGVRPGRDRAHGAPLARRRARGRARRGRRLSPGSGAGPVRRAREAFLRHARVRLRAQRRGQAGRVRDLREAVEAVRAFGRAAAVRGRLRAYVLVDVRGARRTAGRDRDDSMGMDGCAGPTKTNISAASERKGVNSRTYPIGGGALVLPRGRTRGHGGSSPRAARPYLEGRGDGGIAAGARGVCRAGYRGCLWRRLCSKLRAASSRPTRSKRARASHAAGGRPARPASPLGSARKRARAGAST